jgi:diguanylate cyclase (GGDEF)-like protein
MKVAAAARTWWAAHRRRPASSSRASSALGMTLSRVTSYLLVILAGAMIACAVVGFTVTRRDADRLETERHAALRLALDELHAVFGDTDHFDYGQLKLIERRTGLKDVRFDVDPIADSGREVQSLQNGEGRIVGWFSWLPDRALIDANNRLWSLVATAGVALVLCALLAALLTQRLARSLGRSRETVRKLTSEDALTGLPNQRVMLEKLDDALKCRRSGVVALMLIDLDGFREVNDTLGRGGGDAVMIQIAERLKAALPAGAQLGRFEDDEFAVVVSSDSAAAAAALADTLRADFAHPVFLDQNWQISAGVGIAQAPEDGATGEELSRRAGLALRAAKRDGRATVRRFVAQIETDDAERRFLRRELETAIVAQQLDVHYQPVVAAAGGAIVGVEALARWTHPMRGPIAPSVFIPLAEQSGLMLALGEFVLRRALADGVRWPNISVAVNLSPMQIRDRNLVDRVSAITAETGVAAARVVLEVTEGVLIDDTQETLIRLEALRALGVRIALDDFGTGYSSLSYLQKFPFSQVKIDRAFVASLGATGHAGAIIQSIVTLGHALGMKVVAEGVETDEQRVLLRLAGCDAMQGFLFAKPRPAGAIDTLFAPSASERTRQVAAAAS